MDKSIVFAFSGQGSQYYHMGYDLFNNNPVFRRHMIYLDEIAAAISGESVIEELYNQRRKKNDNFNHLIYSHPAIFMVEYALTQVLIEKGIQPDYVLGTSMGEFASLAAAEVINAEKLLEAVLKQAELLESLCPKGSMIAIMGDCKLYEQVPLLHENSYLASVNYDSHFVVTASVERVSTIESCLKELDILYQVLPVAYGFHSSLIDQSAEEYKKFIEYNTYGSPQIGFASCVSGRLLSEIPKSYLWDAVREPIKLTEIVKELEASKICIYIDLGPSGTLAGFVKRNLDSSSRSETYAVMTPFSSDLENLNGILDILRKGR